MTTGMPSRRRLRAGSLLSHHATRLRTEDDDEDDVTRR